MTWDGKPPNEHGEIRTYRAMSGTWTVADGGGWVPGIFDSEETALAAVDVAWGPLMQAYAEMQKRVNYVTSEDRPITMADLDSLEE